MDLMLTETSPTDEVFAGTNINDLKRPWNLIKWVLMIFCAILGCGSHYKSKLH